MSEARLTPATLHPVGRGWLLGFALSLPAEPAQVWAAASSTEALSRWFPCRVSGSFLPGQELSFRFEGATSDDDVVLTGGLVCLESGSGRQRWAIDWAGDLLTLVVEDNDAAGADGAAGTLVRFSARFDALGRGARDAAGWHVCLASLADVVGTPLPTSESQWAPAFERYAAALGPDAATELPPGAGN